MLISKPNGLYDIQTTDSLGRAVSSSCQCLLQKLFGRTYIPQTYSLNENLAYADGSRHSEALIKPKHDYRLLTYRAHSRNPASIDSPALIIETPAIFPQKPTPL